MTEGNPSQTTTVVALPGFTRGPQHLTRLVEACRSAGYRAEAIGLAPRWLPVLYMSTAHLRGIADRIVATVQGPIVIVGHSAGAAAGTYLASVLRERGADVRGLVYVDGVDSPNHLIRDHLGDLDGVRVAAVLAPPSPCNREGALQRYLADCPQVDVQVVAGAGHGDIEGAGLGIYRRACRDTSTPATADLVLATVLAEIGRCAGPTAVPR